MKRPPRDATDPVWRALANPWRRLILDLLRESPKTSGQVVDALGEDRFMVLAHLRVLRESDLVVTEARGRRRVNHLNAVPIQQIHSRWVSRFEGAWSEALLALKSDAETNEQELSDVG